MLYFNHISKDISPDTVRELTNLYEFYNRLAYCYKIMHKRDSRIYRFLTVSSVVLTGVGGAVGGVTLQPAVIGALVGGSFVIQAYLKQKKLGRRVERLKVAYTSYGKILSELRSYLRGIPYDRKIFLSDARVIDDMVMDECPPVASWANKKYIKHEEAQRERNITDCNILLETVIPQDTIPL